MSETRLTPTSYVILGLVELLKTATPYDLKRGADARRRPLLVAAAHPALLRARATRRGRTTSMSERERGGRRRRLYRLTPKGRDALGQVALRADGRALRAARSGSAEALLRRRPGHAGRGPARCPPREPAGRSSSCARRRRRRTSRGGAAHPRGRDRPRARVRALLVAARQAPRARRLGPELGAVLRERVDHPHPGDARVGELEQKPGVVVKPPSRSAASSAPRTASGVAAAVSSDEAPRRTLLGQGLTSRRRDEAAASSLRLAAAHFSLKARMRSL